MKRRTLVLILVTALALLIAATGAYAAEAFDALVEQMPNQVMWWASDKAVGQSIAEQFEVLPGEQLRVNAIQVWGTYATLNSMYEDNFQLILHAVAPSGGPGGVVYSSDYVFAYREATTLYLGPFPEYRYGLQPYPALTLSPGVYWIEIYNAGVGNPDDRYDYFMIESGDPDTQGRTDLNASIRLANETPGVTWSSIGVSDIAMTLLGESVAITPFTWSPANPQQGEPVTFSLPDGITSGDWKIACYPWVTDLESCYSHPTSQGSFTFKFYEPGNWFVALDAYINGAYAGHQAQWVTVANVAPEFFYPPEVHESAGDNVAEPSFVGQEVYVGADVRYAEDGAFLLVDYGDDTSGGGTCSFSVGSQVCLSDPHTYAAAGDYNVTVVVTDPDGLSVSGSVVHSVISGVPEVTQIVIGNADLSGFAEPSLVGQEVIGGAYVWYAGEGSTCTIDYGDAMGPQAGEIMLGEVDVCVGPVHTYAAAGAYAVTVEVTNSRGTGSNSVIHEVAEPLSISPTSAKAGSGDVTLTVTGNYLIGGALVRFGPESQVYWYWGGPVPQMSPLATTYVSPDLLTAVIPAEQLASVGTALVGVYTPLQSGDGTSVPLAFFVTEAVVEVTAQDLAYGANPSASTDSASAAATGDGWLVVAEYGGNPGGTPSFSASGDYFDVYALPNNTFSQVEIVACGLSANDKLYWWNGTAWAKASPQSYDAATGCVTLLVTDSSSPSLSELQGTYFVAGLPLNTAPVANAGGPYLGAIKTAIAFDGTGSSDADGDGLNYAWTFGDGASGTGATPTHTYAAAGIYNVGLTVNDGTDDSATVSTIAVVYDPSAGFATGSGWIDSQPGAYRPDLTLSGKATFGFESKYKKGASAPEGGTEFQFEVAGFVFHSTAYEWLVVNKGVMAQFKGSGTVNDALAPNGSAYKFMLWASDGSPDTFRIKIWWKDGGAEVVVYDNGSSQAISGGNIVVHAK